MKKQILFKPDNRCDDICRTIKTTYHKISTANLIRGGAYGASGVIEIETMQELINADSNGNARAIRACYGQCGFDSVFRGGARNNRSYGRNRNQNRRLHTGQQGQSRET